jgi:hypothetical protein
MNRFEFKMTQGTSEYDDDHMVTMVCNEVHLDGVLERFAEFLRGCGYVVHNIKHTSEEE